MFDLCECGHTFHQHQRIEHSVYPCRSCTCTDYHHVTDDQAADDIIAILKPVDE